MIKFFMDKNEIIDSGDFYELSKYNLVTGLKIYILMTLRKFFIFLKFVNYKNCAIES